MTTSDSALKNSSTNVQQRRVPAWRRIGLELTYAKNVVDIPDAHFPTKDQIINEAVTATAPKNQDRENGDTRKKRKLAHLAPSQSSNDSAPLKHSEKISEVKSKKRVSFSPSVANGGLRSDSPATSLNSEGTVKPSAGRLPNLRVDYSSKPSHQKINASLAYLGQYHTSRESWKFNKSKEIWLFKNALSVEHIPSSYNLALSTYLRGLRGDQAKSRLRTSAEEAILNDKETGIEIPIAEAAVIERTTRALGSSSMDDPVARQAAYERAINRYRRRIEQCLETEDSMTETEDPKLRERLAKRKRAELVLWSVGPSKEADAQLRSHESDEDMQDRSLSYKSSEKSGLTSGAKQKRKLRVAKVETLSRRSDSSSDSSNEDTGSDTPRTPRILDSRVHSTSRSGTESTSSSDSDSISKSPVSGTDSNSAEGDETTDGTLSSDEESD